jgi:hypothetical protein
MLPHSPGIMKPWVKVGVVVAGYVVAVAVAAAAAACHTIVLTDSGNPTNGGMYAFGDSLLFLAAFAVAAMFPTGAAFFFLRPYPAFWRGFSGVALVFATTSLMAFIAVALDRHSTTAGWAVLRLLVAPLFALLSGFSVFFAPNLGFRIALLIAAMLEATGFAGWVITFFLRS